MSLRILYAGSPEAARDTLKILFENQTENDFEIVGVLSNPPTAKGRHKELTPTPVAAFAIENNIPVFTPDHLDSQAREEISAIKADLLVCFAYGHIFGPKFLAMFSYGGMNIHPSLLPKYRGCTPVPAAILNRDKETAVTVQTLSLKMDEGDILAQEIVELNGTETGESLLNYSAEIGAKLVCKILKESAAQKSLIKGVPQQGEASYTGIITKNDGKIDWNEAAEVIEAKIRAYYPDPGCWTMENGVPLRILKSTAICEEEMKLQYSQYLNEENGKVLEYNKGKGIIIKTGKGLLCVLRLQRQGKNPMEYKDFMNGARNFAGTILQ